MSLDNNPPCYCGGGKLHHHPPVGVDNGEGQKGQKLAKFSLIPWGVMREVAEHYGRGMQKYAARNWEKGYPWSSSYDALQRHLESFWNRDEYDDDPEIQVDGYPRPRHIIAVVWHALALAFFSRYEVGTDDRPTHMG